MRRLDPAKQALFEEHAEKPKEQGGFGWSKRVLKRALSIPSKYEVISNVVDRLSAKGGIRGAATRARTRMQAQLKDLDRPSDADDDEHDAAQGEASAAKATGKCPMCRKPLPRKLVPKPKAISQLLINNRDRSDCYSCFNPLVTFQRS